MSHEKPSFQHLGLAFAGSIALHVAMLWFPAFSNHIPIFDNTRGQILSAEITQPPTRNLGARQSPNPTKISFIALSIPHTHKPLSREPRLVENSVDPLFFDDTKGILELQLTIDSFGRASSVKVLRTTLPTHIEGQVVLRFFKAQYHPGEVNGKRVASPITLHIELF